MGRVITCAPTHSGGTGRRRDNNPRTNDSGIGSIATRTMVTSCHHLRRIISADVFKRCAGREPGTARSTGCVYWPARFGGDSVWGERFTGLIDEVRIYNRALSISEIQSDMKTAISTP